MKITNDLVRSRFLKLEQLQELGIAPYAYSYRVTHQAGALLADPAGFEQRAERVRIAGRLISKRPMGKAGFGHLLDGSGRIQLYFKKNEIGDDAFALFKLLDVGDLIGIEGTIFKTRTGEWTVQVCAIELLAKSLMPLPEKWHGLRDKETRYRQRYTDLIMNEEVREIFRLRTRIVTAMRRFLDDRDFLEVETPALQPIYGGAFARPFTTHHNALDMQLYLRVSDELYLKRLIVGGFERVYEIGKDFRNEGVDRNHNPEFTMLELYQAYADYEDVMELTESLIGAVLEETGMEPRCTYRGQQIDWTPPFRRQTYFGALSEAVGLEIIDLDDGALRGIIADRGLEMPQGQGREACWDRLFDDLVQPGLIQPTFIIDYPREISPLAKLKRGDERLVERFEIFAGGAELGNAFSEQNDPLEQERALTRQEERRQAGDLEAQTLDLDYIRALMIGMPPTGGFGMGVDRLAMLLSGAETIRDIVLFPLLRREADDAALDAHLEADAAVEGDQGAGEAGEEPAGNRPTGRTTAVERGEA